MLELIEDGEEVDLEAAFGIVKAGTPRVTPQPKKINTAALNLSKGAVAVPAKVPSKADQAAAAVAKTEEEEKPFYKKPLFIIGGVVVVVGAGVFFYMRHRKKQQQGDVAKQLSSLMGEAVCTKKASDGSCETWKFDDGQVVRFTD